MDTDLFMAMFTRRSPQMYKPRFLQKPNHLLQATGAFVYMQLPSNSNCDLGRLTWHYFSKWTCNCQCMLHLISEIKRVLEY